VSSGMLLGIGLSYLMNGRFTYYDVPEMMTIRDEVFISEKNNRFLYPFVNVSYRGQKRIKDHMFMQVQLGLQYYFIRNNIELEVEYYDRDYNSYIISVNDAFTPLRPYVKVALIWQLKQANSVETNFH